MRWATSRPGEAKYRTLVLLQPTSPLAEPADLVAAVERLRIAGGAPVTSVTATHPASWHLATDAEGVLRALIKATASDDRLLAGAFYVVDAGRARAGSRRFVEPGRTIGLSVPAERSDRRRRGARPASSPKRLLAARPIRPCPDRRRGASATARCFVIAEAGVNHNGDADDGARG